MNIEPQTVSLCDADFEEITIISEKLDRIIELLEEKKNKSTIEYKTYQEY